MMKRTLSLINFIAALTLMCSLTNAQVAGNCYRLHNQGDGATYFLSSETDSTTGLINDLTFGDGSVGADTTLWKLLATDKDSTFKLESILYPNKLLTAVDRADTALGYRVLLTMEVTSSVEWKFTDNSGAWNLEGEIASDDTPQFLHGGAAYDGVRTVRLAKYTGPRSQWLLVNATCPSTTLNRTISAPSFSKAYPNPFTNKLTLNYTIEKDSYLTLDIIGVDGRVLYTLVSEFKTQGEHSVTFDATDLNPGMYFYRISTDYNTDVKEIIRIK